MTYVLNRYPNLSDFFNLSIIILTVVLFVTIIRIMICVESTRVIQYKWDSWHQILVCTNISQFNFWLIDVNGGCERLIERPRTITSSCHHAASVFIMSDPSPTGDKSVSRCSDGLPPPPHHWLPSVEMCIWVISSTHLW